MAIHRFIIFFLTLIIPSLLFSQQQSPNYKTFIAKIGYEDTLINLEDKFIIQYSDKLTLQNNTLSPLNDYNLDYRDGIITLSKDLFSKYKLDTFQIYNLKIEYDVFPYNFKDEYSNFDVVVEKDTITGDTVEIATQKKDFMESIFEGTELEKSGSLFRGITVGSNRDLTVNSGFRLQLNGKLSSDLEINAALTDEDSPIQPEGNTEKLQELDKVFIEIKNKSFTGTIGDLNIDFVNTEFVNFKRKIQGAKGFSDYGIGNVLFSGAVQRGKYASNSFRGRDGIQGPYVLVGNDNELNILVLSGSEKVYIDGISMIRGEQADYVIDYGIGTITFNNKRLITNASRIIVDFEYTDKKYSRTILTGANNLNLLNNKLTFGISYVNENDNENKPIDFSLTPQDISILTNAGDDRYNAVKSGVLYAGYDSTTGQSRGLYVKKDTLINGNTVNYYKYLPGDTNAVYQIVFSYVGQGRGDYIQQSSFQYDFAGIDNGSFDTVVFIPVPNQYQVADVIVNYESSSKKELTFNLETAVSSFDPNKFSPVSDQNNSGVAFNGALGFNKQNFKFLGMNLNSVELKLREKLVNRIFVPLERYNPVEFYREYDIQDSTKLTEDLREASLLVKPASYIDVNAMFGQLLRGTTFNALRSAAYFNMKNDQMNIPQVIYKIELIKSNDELIDIRSNWIRQFASAGHKNYFGDISYDNTNIELRVDYEQERRQNFRLGLTGDSLVLGSFSYFEIRPVISLNNFQNFNLYAGIGVRDNSFPVNGILENESHALTQTYGMGYSGLSWLSTLFELTYRNKEFTNAFLSETNTNNNTLLVNWQTRIDPFNNGAQTDLYYNITSERQAKIEKVFVPVPTGQGNYIYLGDLNENGLQDENEFQLTNSNNGNYVRINRPTSELFPVTVLNSSVRFNLKPARFFSFTGPGFINELFRNTSLETYFRTEEKSQDPNTNNIYFLHFNTFRNDVNTLFGTEVFQQDINFFEFNPSYSLKLRYIQQRAFNQYVSGNERLFTIQRTAKLKLGLTKDITTLLEYQNNSDGNTAPVNSVRNRDINTEGLLTDFSYRPVQEIESGFQINFARSVDSYPFLPIQADINQQVVRFVYSFALLGRLRFELERDDVSLNRHNVAFPYELTNGRVEGISYVWRTLFDYSISKNLQATFNYDGRVEGNRQVIHNGRAEVKAFF